MSVLIKEIVLREAMGKFESAKAILGCVDSMLCERDSEPLIIDESKSTGLMLIFGQVDELIASGMLQLGKVVAKEIGYKRIDVDGVEVFVDRPGLTADPQDMPDWVVSEIDAVLNLRRG